MYALQGHNEHSCEHVGVLDNDKVSEAYTEDDVQVGVQQEGVKATAVMKFISDQSLVPLSYHHRTHAPMHRLPYTDSMHRPPCTASHAQTPMHRPPCTDFPLRTLPHLLPCLSCSCCLSSSTHIVQHATQLILGEKVGYLHAHCRHSAHICVHVCLVHLQLHKHIVQHATQLILGEKVRYLHICCRHPAHTHMCRSARTVHTHRIRSYMW